MPITIIEITGNISVIIIENLFLLPCKGISDRKTLSINVMRPLNLVGGRRNTPIKIITKIFLCKFHIKI